LWAEVEDKNKKLAQLTKERDTLSNEMEKQVQVSPFSICIYLYTFIATELNSILTLLGSGHQKSA
jgi:hypothetical protein